MTTVGYGDVNPVSNAEKIFAMIAMMVCHISVHSPGYYKIPTTLLYRAHVLSAVAVTYMYCAFSGGMHYVQFHHRFYIEPHAAQPK